MSTLRTINVIHPSGSTTNIVNDNAGNVAVGGTLTASTITSPASTALTIQSAGTTAMTIDTSQNVGIGTSSPAFLLDVTKSQNGSTSIQAKNNNAGASATSDIYVNNGTTYAFFRQFGTGTGFANQTWLSTTSANPLVFGTNTTEAARIDSSGNLLVGTTSQPNGTYPGRTVVNAGGSYGATYYSSVNPSGYTPVVFLGSGNALAGYINVSGTTSSFVGSSDYRLKEDVKPLKSGISNIYALKPVSYKWKSNQFPGEGFIAHELGEIIPLALFGEKDAVNEDGSIKPQGIDMTKIIPHLVAAIQELSAKNDALEAANAAFEARLVALEPK
jgi:hypothetical protein